jgi:hypothetical protein
LLSLFEKNQFTFASTGDILIVGSIESLATEHDIKLKQLFLEYRVGVITTSLEGWLEATSKLRAIVSMTSVNQEAAAAVTWGDYAEMYKFSFEVFLDAFDKLRHCIDNMLPTSFFMSAKTLPINTITKIINLSVDHIKMFDLFCAPYSLNSTHFKCLLTRIRSLASDTKFMDDIFTKHQNSLRDCFSELLSFQSVCGRLLGMDSANLQSGLTARSLVIFSTVSVMGS